MENLNQQDGIIINNDEGKQQKSYAKYMIVLAMMIAFLTIGVASYFYLSNNLFLNNSSNADITTPINDSDDWHKLNLKKYPNGPAIQFKSFIDDENMISQNELSYGFVLSKQNNLALNPTKLRELSGAMTKRQLPNGEEIM